MDRFKIIFKFSKWMRSKDIAINALGILVSIVAAIIGLKFSEAKESIIGILILLGFFLFITIFFLITWRVDISAKRDRKVKDNSVRIINLQKDLNSFKETINIIRDLADLKSRISSLENLIKMKFNRRGVIDPRIVIIIIIIILVYLFLKEQGVI